MSDISLTDDKYLPCALARGSQTPLETGGFNPRLGLKSAFIRACVPGLKPGVIVRATVAKVRSTF